MPCLLVEEYAYSYFIRIKSEILEVGFTSSAEGSFMLEKERNFQFKF